MPISSHRKKPSRFELFILEINSFPCTIQVCFLEISLFTVMKSDLSHKMNYSILWETSDFITVNKLISKKPTCIVHGNELISKMKSSNRLGFFSMARYGHPAAGKKFLTSENVFSFSKYFFNFFFTKNVRLLSPPNVLPEMYCYSHGVLSRELGLWSKPLRGAWA